MQSKLGKYVHTYRYHTRLDDEVSPYPSLVCAPIGASHPVVSTSRPIYPLLLFYSFFPFDSHVPLPLEHASNALPLPQSTSSKANAADLAKAKSGGLQRRPLPSLVALPRHPLLHSPVLVLVPAQSVSCDSPVRIV
ncbi:hypothetical protein CGRA01v4_05940 [Colletotrichum graminicola]|nr:hypothetical protein CGRA01v4_05940 [Colletotrichum graminicola]